MWPLCMLSGSQQSQLAYRTQLGFRDSSRFWIECVALCKLTQCGLYTHQWQKLTSTGQGTSLRKRVQSRRRGNIGYQCSCGLFAMSGKGC